jgi:hypothetical protein
VLSNVTDNEIRALEDALLLVQPLVRPESARQANKMLNETNHRNTIHLTFAVAACGTLTWQLTESASMSTTTAQTQRLAVRSKTPSRIASGAAV